MRTEAADKTLWQEEAWDLCRDTGKVSGAQKVRWRVEQGSWALRGITYGALALFIQLASMLRATGQQYRADTMRSCCIGEN